MKIAIIDGINQDIGLNILFPEADYYIHSAEIDKSISFHKYNIQPRYDWDSITDQKYDYLFIIISLYDTKFGTPFFKQNVYDILQKELEIIENNNFKKVCFFDNYDYDYDPNDILQNDKITFFFKRNYNKTKKYKENVKPFPFIMFGETSIIEKLEHHKVIYDYDYDYDYDNDIKHNRVFFSGTLFVHDDPQIDYCRNRMQIYSDISDFIYNPGDLSYFEFLKELHDSKFALDLNGVGDPNKRTFEILSQGTLRIAEYNDLQWPFIEPTQIKHAFPEETIFKDGNDFKNKILTLSNDPILYDKCLQQQNDIYLTYFNASWIKNYLLSFLYH